MLRVKEVDFFGRRFKRSIDDHVEYYRKKNMEEKLRETIRISNLCKRLSEASSRVKFSGKIT